VKEKGGKGGKRKGEGQGKERGRKEGGMKFKRSLQEKRREEKLTDDCQPNGVSYSTILAQPQREVHPLTLWT